MSLPRAVVVLVEGPSDVAAVATLLARSGLASGVEVRSMDGVTNIRAALDVVLAADPPPRVLGLCDEGEVDVVRRAVHDAGVPLASVDDLAAVGFHTCRRDLEDELVRAVGADEVVVLLDQLGLATSFALFRGQPAWRGRDLRASLVRFAGAGSGRKERLAGLLAAALPLDALPEPLAQLLTQVEQARVDEHGPSLGVFAEGVAPAPGG